jgi:hypothetical protein
MLIEELYFLQEKGTLNKRDSLRMKYLLESINDWPQPADTLEDFIEQLKVFLNVREITQSVIEEKIKDLKPQEFAWEREALNNLLELMILNEEKILEVELLQFRSENL